MKTVTPGQEQETSVTTLDVLLLAQALVEAEEALAAGLVIGPPVDKQGIDRAIRRATRRDLARLRTVLAGAA